MSCSGIDEDYIPYGLPAIPVADKTESFWNGRKVEVLDSSHSLLGKGVSIPIIPNQVADPSSFFQRLFVDLTHADLSDDEDEEVLMSENDFEIAQAMAYIGSNYSEGLTVEEILARRGMIFDQQCGQLMECKSLWDRICHGTKKVGHKLEKSVRHGCKKTVEYVKEHKKEIIIGTAIVVTGALIGVAAAAYISAEAAADVLCATATAAGAEAKHASKKRREEDDEAPSSAGPRSASGPDPQREPPSPQPLPREQLPVYQLPPEINTHIVKQFFDNLLKPAPAPDLRSSIYSPEFVDKHINAAPAPAAPTPSAGNETPAQPIYTPQQSSSGTNNIVQQIFGNLLKPTPAPDPRTSIYSPEYVEKHKNDVPTPAATPVAPMPSAGSEAPAPSSGNSNIVQRFFENLLKPTPAPDPSASIYRPEFSEKHKNDTPASAVTSEAASPQSEVPVQSQPPPFKSEFGAYLENLFRKVIDPNYQPPMPQIDAIPTAQHSGATRSGDMPPSSDKMDQFFEKIQQSLDAIRRGRNETEPRNVPLGGSNVRNSSSNDIAVSAPINVPFIGNNLDGKPHVPVMLFTAVTLPTPPDVGVIPVVCPNGKVDLIAVSADWRKFKFSPEELEKGIVNLEEHLGEFIPKMGKDISIITAQNGMKVSLEEFVEDCKADNLKIASAMVSKAPRDCPELPLYVGMYNPTQGLIKDLCRVSEEMREKEKPPALPIIDTAKQFLPAFDFCQLIKAMNGYTSDKNTNTPIVESTRNVMSAIANAAMSINSDVLWLDLRHSEAGLIYCRAFEGMPNKVQEFLHENLLSVAVGPAEPISKKIAKEPVNIYSEKDYVTKGLAKPFMDNPSYDIRVIACISPRGEFSLYLADHARAGTTYDTALDKQIRELQRRYNFFNGREHE